MSKLNNLIISLKESKEIDELTIEKYHIPQIVLMEEAASKIFYQLKKDFDLSSHNICLIAGAGNNGGDCLSLCRYLFFSNYNFDIYLLDSGNYSELNQIHQNILEKHQINLLSLDKLEQNIENYTLIIDGLFGIGYKPRDDQFDLFFNTVNQSKKTIVSIDIPSGLNNENSSSIISNYTYSIGFYKDIFFNENTRYKCGIIKNINISFNSQDIQTQDTFYIDYIRPNNFGKNIFSHKYSKGSICCIGGSTGKYGAIIFCGESALSTGAGISLVLSDEENTKYLNTLSTSLIFDSFQNIDKYKNKYDTYVIGPGLNVTQISKAVILELIKCDKSFILDASFFSAFTTETLSQFKKPPILTPHRGEFKLFFKEFSDEIEKDTINTVRKAAKKHNCFILFKSSFIIFASPNNSVVVFDRPNNILSQAGSGDILSGIIGGFISQGIEINDAIFESLRIFFDIADYYLKKEYRSYSHKDFIKKIRHYTNKGILK